MAHHRWPVAFIAILVVGCGDAVIDRNRSNPPSVDIINVSTVSTGGGGKGAGNDGTIKVEGAVKSGDDEWMAAAIIVKILDAKDELKSYSAKGVDRADIENKDEVRFAVELPWPKGVSKVLVRVIVFGASGGNDGDDRKVVVDRIKERD